VVTPPCYPATTPFEIKTVGMLKDLTELFGYGPDDIRRLASELARRRYDVYSLPFKTIGFRRAVIAARDPLLTDFIEAEYPAVPLLRCNGSVFPVAVYPPEQPPAPIDALSRAFVLDREWKLTFGARSYSFFWLQRALIDAENRPTFVLKAASTAPFSITCGISDFFSTLRTSQALEWELHQAVGWALESGNRDHQSVRNGSSFGNDCLREFASLGSTVMVARLLSAYRSCWRIATAGKRVCFFGNEVR